MTIGTAIVVDTDVVSYVLKRDTRATLYEPLLQGRKWHLSFMTVAELYYWEEVRRWGPRLHRRFATLVIESVIVESDESLCRRWAQVRRAGMQSGHVIALGDAWIAATALHLGVPLVTHNRRDFAAVPGLHLLPEVT